MREAGRPLSQSKLTWRNRIFYGWWIVAGAFVVRAMQGGLLSQAYGSYVVLLREEFGWSKTALSAAYSLAQTEAGLFGPLEGWLNTRFGPRTMIRIGLLMFGGGFILLSQVHSYGIFLAVFVITSAGSTISSFMPWVTTIVNWFERRRTTALGLNSVGWATGALLSPVVILSLENLGWRTTALLSGIMILAIGLPLSQLARSRPEDYGMTADGAPLRARAERASVPANATDYTAREALRSRAFWLLMIGHALAALVVLAVLVHLVSYLHDNRGYSLRTAGFVISALTVSQIVGMLSGGMIADRYSKRMVAFIGMLGHALGVLILAYATTIWMVMAFAIIHGWAWGARGPLMQAIRADYFGRTAFAQIMGFSSAIIVLGSVSGPLVAGFLADQTGDYQFSFTILAGFAAIGSVFFLMAEKPPPPKRLPTVTTPGDPAVAAAQPAAGS